MRNLRRSLWVKIALPVFAVLVVFLVIGRASQASGDKNEPFLAKAGLEFGIICNQLNQTSDMETNFAALKYQGNGNTIGNTISKNKANAAGRILVGENLDKGKMQFHSDPLVIKGEEAVAIVKDLMASIQSYSMSVVDKSDMETPVDVKDQNNYVVDITDINRETVYVSADSMVDAMNAGRIQNGALQIRMRENQTIVFNIKEDKKFEIPRYRVKVTDGSKSAEEEAKTVIWNMPNLVNLGIASDHMHATVIAPNANVNIYTTGEGWLVCDIIVSNNGEWHMIYQDLPDVTPTPEPTKKPKKTEEPTSTPEPTKKPKKTAEPTDTPEPTGTPEATPVWTEDVNKLMTPEPTSTPKTEKPTDTPEATPVWTEDVHKLMTPEPTSTPEPTNTPNPTSTSEATQPPFLPVVTPTPLPTRTPEATPVWTEDVNKLMTPEPTNKPDPTSTPEPTSTPNPTSTPEATQPPFLPVVTPTPLPTGTPEAMDTPLPTSTPKAEEPTNTPEATQPMTTPTVKNEPTPTVEATESPVPSETPLPYGLTEVTESPEPSASPETTDMAEPTPTSSVEPEPSETPLVMINNDDTPLGKADSDDKNKKSTTTIPDNEVPLSDASPKTGDSMNFLIPIAAMGISLIIIIGVMFIRKRKEN